MKAINSNEVKNKGSPLFFMFDRPNNSRRSQYIIYILSICYKA